MTHKIRHIAAALAISAAAFAALAYTAQHDDNHQRPLPAPTRSELVRLEQCVPAAGSLLPCPTTTGTWD